MKSSNKIAAVFAGLSLIVLMVAGISDYYDEYTFNHLSPAEHLRIAKGNLSIPGLAYRHLNRIPSTAPEYREVPALLAYVREQDEADKRALEKEQRETREFKCGTSPDGEVTISFDDGHTWVRDQNGRCAYWAAAKQSDSAGKFYSYWPSSVRVDTDMDSFWLKDEERTCQTYPDEKGRVAVVACNLTGAHRDHNIPVKFWGGVDRGVISSWKCRREGDNFVCRAVD